MAKRAAREGGAVGVERGEAGIRGEVWAEVGLRTRRTKKGALRGWTGGVAATIRRKGSGRGVPAVKGGGIEAEVVGEDTSRGEGEERE